MLCIPKDVFMSLHDPHFLRPRNSHVGSMSLRAACNLLTCLNDCTSCCTYGCIYTWLLHFTVYDHAKTPKCEWRLRDIVAILLIEQKISWDVTSLAMTQTVYVHCIMYTLIFTNIYRFKMFYTRWIWKSCILSTSYIIYSICDCRSLFPCWGS